MNRSLMSPDPPSFNKAKCKVQNTTVFLGWLPPRTKSCIDYYIVEVDLVKSAESVTRKRSDRKFERVYQGPAHEFALYSVPYSVNVVARVLGTNLAGDGTPSEELVLATPRGADQFLVSLCAPFHGDLSSGKLQLAFHDNPLGVNFWGCGYWIFHIANPYQLSSQNRPASWDLYLVCWFRCSTFFRVHVAIFRSPSLHLL